MRSGSASRGAWWLTAFVVAGAAALVSASLVGCNRAPASNADAGGEPDQDDAAPCKLIESIPATLIVTSATGMALPCDATFALVGSGGSMTVACGNVGNPCEPASIDAGLNACPYSLYIDGQSATVTVSQPGYVSQEVPNVFDGVAGCVARPSAASQTAVVLVPVGDGGAEAGRDAPDVSDADARGQ